MMVLEERHIVAQVPPQNSLADIGKHLSINLTGAFICRG